MFGYLSVCLCVSGYIHENRGKSWNLTVYLSKFENKCDPKSFVKVKEMCFIKLINVVIHTHKF